jgi:pyruvate/2-oxoglutarate dehydrogenase complex dihydrolipoamide acyltransferase (E2) component
MFGILEFTAIINLPQCAILAVGGGTPVLGQSNAYYRQYHLLELFVVTFFLVYLLSGADGKFRQMMRSSLSYDARAIGDDDAAEFLDIYQSCLETPEILLRGSAGSTRQRHAEIYSN